MQASHEQPKQSPSRALAWVDRSELAPPPGHLAWISGATLLVIALYLDHDSSDAELVMGLRRAGLDVLTTRDAGNALRSDDWQLRFALSERRAIYSANVGDFGRLHKTWMAAGIHHAGIIVRHNQRMPVSQLYNRISRDPRHRDVLLLTYEEITERRFAGWSMGVIDLSRLNPALLLKYSEKAVLDPYSLSGKVSMALFEELIATASVTCSP